jgi:hypothetical protein
MEMSGIRSPRQREDIARVMSELSLFRTLLCRSLVMRLGQADPVIQVQVDRPRLAGAWHEGRRPYVGHRAPIETVGHSDSLARVGENLRSTLR